MYNETLCASTLEKLDLLIEKFLMNKVVYNVYLRKVGMDWQADIICENIIEEEE